VYWQVNGGWVARGVARKAGVVDVGELADGFLGCVCQQEDMERKRKLEEERKEQEEYLRLKEEFVVEEEGEDATDGDEVSEQWVTGAMQGVGLVGGSEWRKQ